MLTGTCFIEDHEVPTFRRSGQRSTGMHAYDCTWPNSLFAPTAGFHALTSAALAPISLLSALTNILLTPTPAALALTIYQ